MIEGDDEAPGIADEALDAEGPGALVDCWRCGKAVDEALPACPHCRARLVAEGPATRGGRREAKPRDGLGAVLYLYMAFLATSVIYGWAINFSMDRAAPRNDRAIWARLYEQVGVEAVDTLLVLVGIAWAGRPPAPPSIGLGRRVGAWLGALPTLAALLAANYGYFRLLREFTGLPVVANPLLGRPEFVPWLVLIDCVQPAVVEELFFRYLALGHLRPLLGSHGAVLVSAVMFGVAHIFNPIGLPYLIVAGVVFGYARVWGKSLLIPVLMHFAHNAIVTWAEPWL